MRTTKYIIAEAVNKEGVIKVAAEGGGKEGEEEKDRLRWRYTRFDQYLGFETVSSNLGFKYETTLLNY